METNEYLQKEIQQAFQQNSTIHVYEIAVIVKDGVVTLSGIVDAFEKKQIAEDIARNVVGVKAVIENITLATDGSKSVDTKIASSIVDILNENENFQKNAISIKVEKGWVSLEGDVISNKEKNEITEKIQTIAGIKGITNNIHIIILSKNELKTNNLRTALAQTPILFDKIITITVTGNNVVLKGIVDSQNQKNEAGKVAYNSTGIFTVENQISIKEIE